MFFNHFLLSIVHPNNIVRPMQMMPFFNIWAPAPEKLSARPWLLTVNNGSDIYLWVCIMLGGLIISLISVSSRDTSVQ